jgi:hypothetical protein
MSGNLISAAAAAAAAANVRDDDIMVTVQRGEL